MSENYYFTIRDQEICNKFNIIKLFRQSFFYDDIFVCVSVNIYMNGKYWKTSLKSTKYCFYS